MEYAEAAGKEIEDSAVFDDVGINLTMVVKATIRCDGSESGNDEFKDTTVSKGFG